jgi:hypothetical protein
VLHKRYPIMKKGIISVKNLDFEMAKTDHELLKKLKFGDVEDDNHLVMTSLWISKLRVAISKEAIEDDSDSETN